MGPFGGKLEIGSTSSSMEKKKTKRSILSRTSKKDAGQRALVPLATARWGIRKGAKSKL